MFPVAAAVSRRGSASCQKRLPATCSAILAIGSSCRSCVFTAFSCPRVVMVTVKCWSRTRLLIICTPSPRGSACLQRTASLPMARSGMLSAGQPASVALLTTISRVSGEPCSRVNLQLPSPESDTLAATDTLPPSILAAVPSVSHGQTTGGLACDAFAGEVCGTGGAAYWPDAAFEKLNNASRYSRRRLSMASAKLCPWPARADQISESCRPPGSRTSDSLQGPAARQSVRSAI